MTELLKTRFVFVDTSMYEGKNFQFHQYSLGRFKELCNEQTLYLLMNSIIEHEIRLHLIEQAHEAAKHVKEFKKAIKILRNLPEIEHHAIFGELLAKRVEELLLDKFLIFKEEAVYEEIDINLASITTIVAKYFSSEPPFSEKKKHEFPDSITLESLLVWSKNKKTPVYVLSTDGDMREFCALTDGMLIYVDNIDDFINLVITNENKISDLSRFAEEQLETQIDAIKSRLDELINTIEYSASNYEIDDEVDDVEAYGLVILNRNIIKADRNYAEFSLSIKFTVEAWHNFTDFNRSIWDSEDKTYIFTANSSTKVKHEVHATAYLWIDFEDGLAANTEITEINIENSYIELDINDGEVLDHHEKELFDGDYD